MKLFIQLTGAHEDNKIVYVNKESIFCLANVPGLNRSEIISSGGVQIEVEESPVRVLELIEQTVESKQTTLPRPIAPAYSAD